MAELVTLSKSYDLPEAVIIRSLLDQHGVPVFLFDYNLCSTAWGHIPALSGMRVMVFSEDLEDARSILGDLSHRIVVEDDETCPACGSDDLFRPASWMLGLAVIMLIGVPILVQSHRRHCRSCHHNWRGEEGTLV